MTRLAYVTIPMQRFVASAFEPSDCVCCQMTVDVCACMFSSQDTTFLVINLAQNVFAFALGCGAF
jgi:hypothetical protein